MLESKYNVDSINIEETQKNESQYATKKTVITALIPVAVTVPFLAHKFIVKETYSTINVPVPPAVTAPQVIQPVPSPFTEPTVDVLSQAATYVPTNAPSYTATNTGFIADKSLEVLAHALDPVIQLMVAISLPIASVIMIGACFFFMFGNAEKAWDMIMKAGLGFVLIQMSPLFLDILKTVGEAV